jgi:hypothetical protein
VAGWPARQVDVLRVGVELVSPNRAARDCRLLGAHIASRAAGEEPVGLLVLGDGSARHTDRGPGGLDARAGAFELPYSGAPYGVRYHVAVWDPP